MKIISKFKDYYDYLSGVWGEDPLLTYVRKSEYTPIYDCNDCTKVKIYIGGMLVEALLYKGVFYYGENIEVFTSELPWYITMGKSSFNSSRLEYGNVTLDKDSVVFIARNTLRDGQIDPYRDMFILRKPIVDTQKVNERENCPVVLEIHKKFYKNPILKELKLNSFISPEQTYRLISDWLSLQRTKAEDRPDIRTNVQKVESHGFDNKTSFRPNIKN